MELARPVQPLQPSDRRAGPRTLSRRARRRGNAVKPLDRETRARLAKLLGLLGSDFDGEIAAAGRAANGLVRAASCTWFDVVLPDSEPQQSRLRHHREIVSTNDAIEFCLSWPGVLTDWERRFVRSLRDQGRSVLSLKQFDILARVVAKARCAEAMAA